MVVKTWYWALTELSDIGKLVFWPNSLRKIFPIEKTFLKGMVRKTYARKPDNQLVEFEKKRERKEE